MKINSQMIKNTDILPVHTHMNMVFGPTIIPCYTTEVNTATDFSSMYIFFESPSYTTSPKSAMLNLLPTYSYLLHAAESLLRSYPVFSQSRNSPHFIETKGSLPHS
jgi:hypothetical protein